MVGQETCRYDCNGAPLEIDRIPLLERNVAVRTGLPGDPRGASGFGATHPRIPIIAVANRLRGLATKPSSAGLQDTTDR
jgi:hypothetical protein